MSVLGNISSIVLTVSNISPSFFHCSFEIVVDRIDRVLAHVTASSVRAHGVVVDQPDIRVVLRGFHTLVELVAEGWLEELIKNGAIEPFRKTICLRAGDFGFGDPGCISGRLSGQHDPGGQFCHHGRWFGQADEHGTLGCGRRDCNSLDRDHPSDSFGCGRSVLANPERPGCAGVIRSATSVSQTLLSLIRGAGSCPPESWEVAGGIRRTWAL